MVLAPKKTIALVSASATTVTLYYIKVLNVISFSVILPSFFVRNLTPTEKEGKVKVALFG